MGHGARRALLLTFVIAGMGCLSLTALARAEGCPNERLREQEGAALRLPDCRAYEQVSPVDKNFTDAAGIPGLVQSSPLGEGVTFFSAAPFPGVPSAASIPVYLSSRSDGEWSTQGLAPPLDPPAAGGPEEGLTESFTEDLAEAIVLVEPGLEAGMAPGLYSYLRDSATGAFRLLGAGVATFADAANRDSRIIFESREHLLPEAAPNVINLYEWDGSKPYGQELSLAGVLPDGRAPIAGSVAGPGGPALGGSRGGATGKFYTQDTISEDGARVFFSDVGTGEIYMHEPESGRTIPVSAGIAPAYWRAATTDGSDVFYTEGEDLYRFSVASETREALTDGAAGVLGTLGIATENGSYVYFAATGVLASNENGNKEQAEAGKANLYEWHEGKAVFMARLSLQNEYDGYDWRDFYGRAPTAVPDAGEKASRVSPDGLTVLLGSRARLTGYNNADQGELYLYEASSDKLVCVSCNPNGTPAIDESYLAENEELNTQSDARALLTRNLSDDGDRVFFQTKEALLPQDKNEQADVYEWEREGAGGSDGCSRSSASFNESSGGCLYLISTGESGEQSYFGDASADGGNVFFFTRQSLVGQDRDENDDLYDARVEGGIPAQNPPPTSGCSGEGCLGPVLDAPAFAAPSSAVFVGPANATPQPPAKPRAPTRAQRLAKALKACGRKPKKRRRMCAAGARKRYGKRTARKPARAHRSVRERRP